MRWCLLHEIAIKVCDTSYDQDVLKFSRKALGLCMLNALFSMKNLKLTNLIHYSPEVFLLTVEVVKQCAHDGICPMDGTDKYCHFSQRLARSSSQLLYKVLILAWQPCDCVLVWKAGCCYKLVIGVLVYRGLRVNHWEVTKMRNSHLLSYEEELVQSMFVNCDLMFLVDYI